MTCAPDILWDDGDLRYVEQQARAYGFCELVPGHSTNATCGSGKAHCYGASWNLLRVSCFCDDIRRVVQSGEIVFHWRLVKWSPELTWDDKKGQSVNAESQLLGTLTVEE